MTGGRSGTRSSTCCGPAASGGSCRTTWSRGGSPTGGSGPFPRTAPGGASTTRCMPRSARRRAGHQSRPPAPPTPRRGSQPQGGRAPEPTACSLDAQSVQSAEGGEAIGFDKFKHCRGRKRNLVVDTCGFLLARTVTSAQVSDRAAGRQVLRDAKERHPDLAYGWADGGYANAVDDSILAWARQTETIELEVVKRIDDVKGFAVLPWRWVVERTNAWVTAHRRCARDYERLTETSGAMIDLAMIDVLGNRLAGGTCWEQWRTVIGPEPQATY